MISLVALPGGGKSTAGRLLARRLDWAFVDADAVLEQQLGCRIRDFFARAGEAAFRDAEEAAIAELTARGGQVVLATGGGAVLRPANRQALKERTTAVYLRASPEDLFKRLRHDTQRPLLQVADPLARLRELYRERDPLYRAVAHFVVDTGRPSMPVLVNKLLMQLELGGALPVDARAGQAAHAPDGTAPDPHGHAASRGPDGPAGGRHP